MDITIIPRRIQTIIGTIRILWKKIIIITFWICLIIHRFFAVNKTRVDTTYIFYSIISRIMKTSFTRTANPRIYIRKYFFLDCHFTVNCNKQFI